MLKPGDRAPRFSAPNSDLQMVRLEDFLGQRTLVLYFYPKDDTPGCTIEALEFTDLMPEFEAADTAVLGVSMDPCVSHGAFRDKHGLTVNLLADIDGDLCNAFGVLVEKEVRGELKKGIRRSTFIIDKEGIIRRVFPDVKPKGHAQEVLEYVRQM